MTNDEAIMEHATAVANAKRWMERERELRSLIYGNLFGSLADGTTHTHELGNGYKLKAKRPLNYKVDAGLIDDALDKIVAIGNSGAFLADRVIKWKPELSLTEYKQLSDEQRQVLDVAITMTPGLPSLELVEPK